MTAKGTYRNHQHYIDQGWSPKPKEMFRILGDILQTMLPNSSPQILDVGCATGELLGHLSTRLDGGTFFGVDVEPTLIATARKLLPQAHFAVASALDLPSDFHGKFDAVCSVGCMSIFDETQIDAYWKNLLDAVRPGGIAIALSPLNEYGIDAMIRHRKRIDGHPNPWETGWNIFSVETIRETIEGLDAEVSFRRFEIPFSLPQQSDPVRTWTMATEAKERQLTNGIKLLVDHYFMVARPRPKKLN